MRMHVASVSAADFQQILDGKLDRIETVMPFGHSRLWILERCREGHGHTGRHLTAEPTGIEHDDRGRSFVSFADVAQAVPAFAE